MLFNKINKKQSFYKPGRLILLLFVCIFLFNIGGYFFYFKTIQFSIRQQIKSKIRSELRVRDLCLITVTLGQDNLLQWEEKDREFRYQGQMFDVIKKEIHGNIITYHCINDTKESILVADLIRHHQENSWIQKILKKVEPVKIFPSPLKPGEIVSSFHLLCQMIGSEYLAIVPDAVDPPPKAILI